MSSLVTASSSSSATTALPEYRLKRDDLVGVWTTSEVSFAAAIDSQDAEYLAKSGVFQLGSYSPKTKAFVKRTIQTRNPGYVLRWEFDESSQRLTVHNDGTDERITLHGASPDRFKYEVTRPEGNITVYEVRRSR